MKEDYERQLREKDRIIAAQKKEIAVAYKDVINMRKNWMQVFEDMEKEHRTQERILIQLRKTVQSSAIMNTNVSVRCLY